MQDKSDSGQAKSIEQARPDLSLVIPLFNEEESLGALHQQLSKSLGELDLSYEILFINDGSTDQSAEVLEKLAQEDPAIGLVHFRRNFGKAAALDAGFKRALGDVVITMDADLQDDPAAIKDFLLQLDKGYDVVSGWKKVRHDPAGKVLPSRFFNFVVSRVSGIKLHDFNCGFKAYRREALNQLELYGELHRFVPVLLHWQGFRATEIVVPHHPREFGVSKYGVERMAKGFFDLLTTLAITRFRARPMHLFGLAGLVSSALGLLILSYLTILWFAGLGPIGSRPLLFLGVLLVMVGVQLFGTGLLAEIMNRSQHGRPVDYVIRQEKKPKAIPAQAAAATSRTQSS